MEQLNTSSDDMIFGNIVDQLASAALLDVETLESIAATIDFKLDSLQSRNTETSEDHVFQHFNIINVKNSQNSACETDPMALNCFLTNIVQALKHNQGFEDSILREFLKLCSRNGFVLPPVDSIMLEAQGSAVSLNTMAAEEEEIKTSLWQEIRSKIKSGIIIKLRQSNLLNRLNFDQPGYQKEILMRVQVIDLLMAVFPVHEILDMYSTIREEQLDMYAVGTKKYSVSWADEDGSNKMKELDNLEAFIVTQLDMMNMDIPILWILSKSLSSFSMLEFVEKVYFPRLQRSVDKVVSSFMEKTDGGQRTQTMLLPVASSSSKVAEPVDWGDVQFISKAFSIIWNWENEASEIIGYFDVQVDLQDNDEVQGLRGVLKGSPNSSPSISKQDRLGKIMWDEEKDRSKTKADIKWPWREQFKPVVQELQKCIIESLRNYDVFLQSDDTDINSIMVDVHDRIARVNTDYPSKVTKKFAILVSTFDEVLPLASHGGGPVFEPVKEAFVEGISSCLRECHSDLCEVIDAFTECSGVEGIYNLFCSLAFICQHLRFYEENIVVDKPKPFRYILKMYDELFAKTRSVIISCHLKMLNTVVLFDANSNNWTDNKQFQEGEKYSYCIQMWSYYLRCVHSDIWNSLPLCESKKILFAITNESLVLLTGRYSKIRPSFARIKQYCADVTAICDVCVWVMWMLADSVSDLISPQINGSEINQWHSLCSSMLTNMITLSAPLKLVADYLTNKDEESEQITKTKFDLKTLLLMWSEPCLFTKSVQSMNELDDKEAVFLVFRIIVSLPHPKWSAILQAILMRGALLPTLIAANSGDFCQVTKLWRDKDFQSSHLNVNFIESAGCCLSKLDLQEFVGDVYNLLLNISAKSDALAHFLMALANCENIWSLFDSHIIVGSEELYKTPLWLQNIEKSLIPYLSRAFAPSLEMICESDRVSCLPSFAFKNLETLPCGCTTIKDDKSSSPSSEGELLYQCLVSTLELLTDSLNTMPRIIAVFFNRLNEYLYQRHFSAATKSPGLKILAFISYKWLTVQENIGLLFDFPISDATMGKIKCFAELVWHVLFNLTTDVSQNPSIPSEILSYIKGSKTWLQEKLKLLTTYFKASGVNSCNNCLDQDQMPDDLAANQYTTLTATLMSFTEGRESLTRIYEILKANKERIEEKLLSSRTSAPGRVCQQSSLEEKARDDIFNPLKEYSKFGDYLHNQEESIELQHDWNKWLPVLDLLPLPVLRRTILGRQEFLPDSYNYLTEEEKIAHETLSRFFESGASRQTARPDSSDGSSERSFAEDSK